jgi:hypothetical protein
MFITGQTESIIAHGSFAAAGGAPPASSATLPLLASGVERNPARDRLEFRIAQVGALAVTSNPCGKLYVTTGMTSWVRPGSVLEVNPDDLTITRSANVGREYQLASDDCSTLYGSRQLSVARCAPRIWRLPTCARRWRGPSRAADGGARAGQRLQLR